MTSASACVAVGTVTGLSCPTHAKASGCGPSFLCEPLHKLVGPQSTAFPVHSGSRGAVLGASKALRQRRRALTRVSTLGQTSNSALRTPPMKARHSDFVKVRTGPVGFLESRTSTSPLVLVANSTHSPTPPLSELLRHPSGATAGAFMGRPSS